MQVGGCHKPKCFPLFLFPSASGITLAQAMQGNCTTSFADTSHSGLGSKHRTCQSQICCGFRGHPHATQHRRNVHHGRQTSLLLLTDDVWVFRVTHLLVRAGMEAWNYLNTSFYLGAAEQHKTLTQLISQEMMWLSVFPYSWVISEHTDNTNLTRDP